MSVAILPRAISAATVDFDSHAWSSAKFFDEPLGDGFTLRALVCPIEGGRWQWSISSFDGVRGELISTGIETSAARARRMATSEIAKCVEDPLSGRGDLRSL